MARSNRERADRFATFGEQYDKAQRTAAKRTAQKMGRKMQKERLQQLAGQSGRRKDGVLYKVTKRGSLVMLDLAPMASAQEYGRVIKPDEGKYLRVPVGQNRGLDPDAKNFVVKTRSGELVLMTRGPGGKPTAWGVLKTKVIIKRNAPSGRFATVLNNNLKNYRDELADQLIRELNK